mmetsp:Transcript_13651/g.37572  ORF Transcript_13651/g.37572 Transcript_13651/m.37572 type:complete len:238 (+) Transcript_13651:52-765(+)
MCNGNCFTYDEELSSSTPSHTRTHTVVFAQLQILVIIGPYLHHPFHSDLVGMWDVLSHKVFDRLAIGLRAMPNLQDSIVCFQVGHGDILHSLHRLLHARARRQERIVNLRVAMALWNLRKEHSSSVVVSFAISVYRLIRVGTKQGNVHALVECDLIDTDEPILALDLRDDAQDALRCVIQGRGVGQGMDDGHVALGGRAESHVVVLLLQGLGKTQDVLSAFRGVGGFAPASQDLFED